MASFMIDSMNGNYQVLGPDEQGFVASTGTLYVLDFPGVYLEGDRSVLTVLGTIVSNSSMAVSAFNCADSVVTVGAAGSLISTVPYGAGLNGVLEGDFTLRNAGTILGGDGVRFYAQGDTGGNIWFRNTGTISAAGTESLSAVHLYLFANYRAHISNAGTLDGATTGGAINSGGPGSVTLNNAGQILGDINLSTGADRVTISGLVMGNVDLGDGFNEFNLAGGTVTGNLTCGSGADSVTISGLKRFAFILNQNSPQELGDF